MTQNEKIIAYCKNYPTKGISSYEAFQFLRITKLSTRIGELEKAGYVFHREWEKNKDGQHMRYWMVREAK